MTMNFLLTGVTVGGAYLVSVPLLISLYLLIKVPTELLKPRKPFGGDAILYLAIGFLTDTCVYSLERATYPHATSMQLLESLWPVTTLVVLLMFIPILTVLPDGKEEVMETRTRLDIIVMFATVFALRLKAVFISDGEPILLAGKAVHTYTLGLFVVMALILLFVKKRISGAGVEWFAMGLAAGLVADQFMFMFMVVQNQHTYRDIVTALPTVTFMAFYVVVRELAEYNTKLYVPKKIKEEVSYTAYLPSDPREITNLTFEKEVDEDDDSEGNKARQ